MIVYRLEKNGIGPYTNPSGSPVRVLWSRDRKTRTEQKYGAILDELYSSLDANDRSKKFIQTHTDKSYMYGCSSKKQLKAYFGGRLKPFFADGYRIKRYKVPDEEVVDMGIEVAFPVKYHKLQTEKKVQEVIS